MIREKIKAGDFFTTYYLDSKCEAVYPKHYCKHYCWPIRSIGKVFVVNTEQQYIGCNMIYPPSLYKETFHALIDLEGWRWRYDFDFLFDEKSGIRTRRSSSNEIFRYILEFSTYVQDEGGKTDE